MLGVDAALEENVLLTLGDVYADELESYFFQGRIKKAIDKSTNALGYYHASFDYRVEQGSLLINIIPGTRLLWAPASIHIEGEAALDPQIKTLIAKSPFKPGKPVSHSDYDDFKQQLIDTCLLLGFQNASFTRSELRINLIADNATAILEINSGIRYKIASIEYTGSTLRPKVLESLSVMKEGDWYSRVLVARQYKSLLDTGYFANVEVQPVFDHSTGTVDIQVSLEEVGRNRYLVGAGYGTDTGPRLRLRWSKPLVNTLGHSFYSDLQVSEPIQEVTTRYIIPVGHPLDKRVEWGSGVRKKNIEDTESLLITTGLNLHTTSDLWQQVVGFNIEDEDYKQADEPRQHTTYILPTASWSYTTFSQAENQGYRFWFNTQGSTEKLYSDTDFLRLLSGIKFITPIYKNHLLVARIEAGILINKEFDDVPASKRFFTGGDQTVRGYGYQSLSTRNSDGELTGGDYLNVGSLEYRLMLNQNWALATFVDSGRAYSNSNEPFHTGVGVGTRWYSPIGQVSFDIAFPVNDDDGHDSFQIHIYMGPSI